MSADPKLTRFENTVLPHMNAAFNFARWLMRDEREAEDAAQDAMLRAFRFFGGFRGGDARVWLMTIVRNTCFTRLRGARARDADEFKEEIHTDSDSAVAPEAELIRHADRAAIEKALRELPEEFREVIVMRELEGLAYKEIADITGVPIGTVMSRLARGRARLKKLLVSIRESG